MYSYSACPALRCGSRGSGEDKETDPRVAADVELRSKRELIQRVIENNLPKLGSSADIRDSFEDFWEKERKKAFYQLVKVEQLDADKLKKVIDQFVYTGEPPLPDPDIVELIARPLKLAERGPTRKRVSEKVLV